MQDMDINSALTNFKQYLERLEHYQNVNTLLFWDSMQKVPPKGAVGRAATKGVMAEETRLLQTSSELKGYIDALLPYADTLSDFDRALVRVAKRDYDALVNVRGELYSALEAAKGESIAVWETAMRSGDYALQEPYFDRLIDLNKKLALCLSPKKTPYDALVDYYEEGMDLGKLDALFGELKETIIPLVEKIKRKNVEKPEFLDAHVPKDAQERFNNKLYRAIGVDPSAAMLYETTHPFTFGINLDDIRFSTRYFENDFTASLFSVLHEGGHAINTQNIPHELSRTILGGGASAAFQESQSRFYENVIGRSRAFLEYMYDDFMREYKPYIGDRTPNELFRAFNHCEPGFIRVAADEVTYTLHIIIRYEMERDFINGSVKAADLPAIWNMKIKRYLGLDVPNDSVGILQDIQWPYGRFGAFVSYALGNVYGLMIRDVMEREFCLESAVRSGEFSRVNEWLRKNVHQYSQLYTPDEQIQMITGKGIDAKPFLRYLTDKMTEVYSL
ncbi:MAG: carboxypeptidase M32 [Oscillospiraceae bacterium]|jgi:carboxypeptidase Taq|nr:carboxypeptidase M32 [Oscillospiraceae bacterium]